MLYSIVNINIKMLNSFSCYGISYFKREYHIRLFSKAEVFFQSHKINKYAIIKWFDRFIIR